MEAKRATVGFDVNSESGLTQSPEELTLIHPPTQSRKRRPRYLSKIERRHQRPTARNLAATKLEIDSQQNIMNDIIFQNDTGIMCLPCEDEAFADDMWFRFHKKDWRRWTT